MLRDARVSHWWLAVEELERIRISRQAKIDIYPSPPDWQDFQLSNFVVGERALLKGLPQIIRLHLAPNVIDQLDTPFCAGASGVGSMNSHYDYYDALPEPEGFSWPFLYWMAKEYDGIPDKPGTYLRVVCKMMQKYGVCRYSLLPIEEAKTKPQITQEMLTDASNYKVKRYFRLDTIEAIKEAFGLGLYIMVGTIVTSRNWEAPHGFLGMPAGFVRGAHATYQHGFDETMEGKDYNYDLEYLKYLLGINSWGTKWGDEGKYYMPEKYLEWEAADIPNFRAFLEAWALEFEFVGDKPPQPVFPPDPEPPPPDPEPEPKPQIYLVVAGSFVDKSNAYMRIRFLESKGFEAHIQIRTENDKEYYRVIVGVFSTREEASALIDQLTAAGVSSFLAIQDEEDPRPEPPVPGILTRLWRWVVNLFRSIFGKDEEVMTVTRKPWYKREDFWLAIGAVLSIVLSDTYGIELDVTAFAAIVGVIIAIVWGTTSMENRAMEIRGEMYLADKELQIEQLRATRKD